MESDSVSIALSKLEDLRDFDKEEREEAERRRVSDEKWAAALRRLPKPMTKDERRVWIDRQLDRPTDMDALMDDDSGLLGEWEPVLTD